MEKEEYGYVYVLKNEKMPGLIKIGITRQKDYRQRIKTLNGATGVPVAFEEVHVSKVKKEDCAKIEHALHTAFDTDRVNPKREFFQMEPYRAIAILQLLEIEDVTENAKKETNESLAPQEIEAREKAIEKSRKEDEERRSRRPPLNFTDLGIQKDEVLYWKDDKNIFVKVAEDRKVFFDGEVCSLTSATCKILGVSYNIQPTPYWLYEGKPLTDIYNDRYPPIDVE